MACPFFEPTSRRFEANAIVPLGDLWRGICRAGDEPFDPDERLTGECCNMGYARGRCPRFPEDSEPDAVRFAIAGDSDQTILISFAMEKDHHPYAQGTLEYSERTGGFIEYSKPGLEHLARAYVASYLRRKRAA